MLNFPIVRTLALAAVATVAAVSFGCASPPPASADNLRLTEQEQSQRYVLSTAQQSELKAALSSLTAGSQPAHSPAPAANGVRWSDVELAVYYACLDAEMAVVQTTRSNDVLTFRIRTVNERPAQLIVARVADERVYTAEATCGRFGDDTASAQRLLDALHHHMRLLGAKRGFE